MTLLRKFLIVFFAALSMPSQAKDTVESCFSLDDFLEDHPFFELIVDDSVDQDSILVCQPGPLLPDILALSPSYSSCDLIPYPIQFLNIEVDSMHISIQCSEQVSLDGVTIHGGLNIISSDIPELRIMNSNIKGRVEIGEIVNVKLIKVSSSNFENRVSFWHLGNNDDAIETSIDLVHNYLHSGISLNNCKLKAYDHYWNHYGSSATFSSSRDSIEALTMIDSATVSRFELLRSHYGKEVDFRRIVANHEHVELLLITKELSEYSIPFDRVTLVFNNKYFEEVPDHANSLFQQLLAQTKNSGESQNYQALDLQYQKFYHHDYMDSAFGPFLYWINKNWWNFGYEKPLMLRGIFIILLTFVLINFFVLQRLTTEVYEIKGIKDQLQNDDGEPVRLGIAKRMWLSIYYTAIVFFGMKMEISSFHFNRFRLVGYIFLIYGVGIICLAFLANWILTF